MDLETESESENESEAGTMVPCLYRCSKTYRIRTDVRFRRAIRNSRSDSIRFPASRMFANIREHGNRIPVPGKFGFGPVLVLDREPVVPVVRIMVVGSPRLRKDAWFVRGS